MYLNGQGVPHDYVHAHMWFNLSGGRGHQKALRDRSIVATYLTPAQLTEAQGLAKAKAGTMADNIRCVR